MYATSTPPSHSSRRSFDDRRREQRVTTYQSPRQPNSTAQLPQETPFLPISPNTAGILFKHRLGESTRGSLALGSSQYDMFGSVSPRGASTATAVGNGPQWSLLEQSHNHGSPQSTFVVSVLSAESSQALSPPSVSPSRVPEYRPAVSPPMHTTRLAQLPLSNGPRPATPLQDPARVATPASQQTLPQRSVTPKPPRPSTTVGVTLYRGLPSPLSTPRPNSGRSLGSAPVSVSEDLALVLPADRREREIGTSTIRLGTTCERRSSLTANSTREVTADFPLARGITSLPVGNTSTDVSAVEGDGSTAASTAARNHETMKTELTSVPRTKKNNASHAKPQQEEKVPKVSAYDAALAKMAPLLSEYAAGQSAQRKIENEKRLSLRRELFRRYSATPPRRQQTISGRSRSTGHINGKAREASLSVSEVATHITPPGENAQLNASATKPGRGEREPLEAQSSSTPSANPALLLQSSTVSTSRNGRPATGLPEAVGISPSMMSGKSDRSETRYYQNVRSNSTQSMEWLERRFSLLQPIEPSFQSQSQSNLSQRGSGRTPTPHATFIPSVALRSVSLAEDVANGIMTAAEALQCLTPPVNRTKPTEGSSRTAVTPTSVSRSCRTVGLGYQSVVGSCETKVGVVRDRSPSSPMASTNELETQMEAKKADAFLQRWMLRRAWKKWVRLNQGHALSREFTYSRIKNLFDSWRLLSIRRREDTELVVIFQKHCVWRRFANAARKERALRSFIDSCCRHRKKALFDEWRRATWVKHHPRQGADTRPATEDGDAQLSELGSTSSSLARVRVQSPWIAAGFRQAHHSTDDGRMVRAEETLNHHAPIHGFSVSSLSIMDPPGAPAEQSPEHFGPRKGVRHDPDVVGRRPTRDETMDSVIITELEEHTNIEGLDQGLHRHSMNQQTLERRSALLTVMEFPVELTGRLLMGVTGQQESSIQAQGEPQSTTWATNKSWFF